MCINNCIQVLYCMETFYVSVTVAFSMFTPTVASFRSQTMISTSNSFIQSVKYYQSYFCTNSILQMLGCCMKCNYKQNAMICNNNNEKQTNKQFKLPFSFFFLILTPQVSLNTSGLLTDPHPTL